MRRWILMTALLVTIGAASAIAADDDLDGRWGLGLEGGLWKQFHGDRDYSNVDQYSAFKLRHGLSQRWTLDLGLKYGWLRPGVDTPGDDAGFTLDAGAGLFTRIWQPALTATYRLASHGTLRPWLSLGAGVTRWDVRDLRAEEGHGLWPDGQGLRVYDTDGELRDGHGVNLTAIVGLGAEIWAGKHWSFDLGVRYNYLVKQETDMAGMSALWGADHVDAGKAIVEGFVGASFWFGTPKTVPVMPVWTPPPPPEPEPEPEPVVEEIRDDLVLEGVTFKLGSSELTPESHTTLDNVAASLRVWPEVRIEIGGHTDNTGPIELNRRLSQERAESVRAYLIKRGIDPDRITARGYGPDRPAASNATREGREANRRVQLRRLGL